MLAGGLGTRLYPLTKITNKHLLPVYNRPMIYYPLLKMAEAGIRDVLLVTGGNHAGEFLRLLGDGHEFGLHLHYTYQQGEKGIADALRLAEDFADDEAIAVILGDNIFQQSFAEIASRYAGEGAMIVLKQVDDPRRFGVPEFRDGELVRIVEKPEHPPSDHAVTGIYFYDSRVFDMIRDLEPSARGELEITDVNNRYIREGLMSWFRMEGWWSDAGTFESLFRASALIRQQEMAK